MVRYKNPNDTRITIYLTLNQKRWIIKNGMNLSYFVREKLDSHISSQKEDIKLERHLLASPLRRGGENGIPSNMSILWKCN